MQRMVWSPLHYREIRREPLNRYALTFADAAAVT